MQAPMGFSGVQTVPKSLQSVGSMTPRSTLGHSQPRIYLACPGATGKRRSASKSA